MTQTIAQNNNNMAQNKHTNTQSNNNIAQGKDNIASLSFANLDFLATLDLWERWKKQHQLKCNVKV